MTPILSVLRAVHCRSTHHYFALDALRLVQTDAGLRLKSQLLRHHEKYLDGAKDPDNRFRDFHNHVVHVNQGYFGGAPRLAIKWYDRALGHLVANRFEDAAYAIGVFTHYFTDPLMPLHTAQSEREALVHRPMEWSVFKSYDRILRHWTQDELRLVLQLGDGEGWLVEAILKGARFSNRSYKRLVETYNVDLGCENPVAGLDDQAIQTFAELFGLAITGVARIIERIAYEAESRLAANLPTAGLSMATVLAILQVPEKLWLKRIVDKQEREAIEAILTEYRLTGKVVENLPSEVYIKRRVLEVRDQEQMWSERRRQVVVAAGAQPTEFTHTVASPAESSAATTLEAIAATPLPAIETAAPAEVELPATPAVAEETPVTLPFKAPAGDAKHDKADEAKKRLQLTDELSRAPSIGPKTAAAFAEFGVRTIGNFLEQPAGSLARRLNKSWVSQLMIEDWQAQTRLMCEVSGLLSRDVQLLVGAGCRTVEMLAAAQAPELLSKMKHYADTAEGRRALRGGIVADAETIQRWIAQARLLEMNRRVA